METQLRGYKFRIYPNKEQKIIINKILGSCRFVYNHFLAVRRDEWKANKKSISYVDTCKLLTTLKRYDEFSWLKEAENTAMQQSLRDLDKAYKNFFKKKSGYPRFKSKHSHTQSYRTNKHIHLYETKIKLPKLTPIKIKVSRQVSGKIKNATITHTASDKYFVSLCIEEELVYKQNKGNTVGIDVGIKEFYTDSNGNTVNNPKYLKKYEKKLAREQRRLSRKMPRSNNGKKQRIKVAIVYEKITNCRKDFLNKESTKLVHENQMVAIEDLKISNMMKNHKLAKAIADVSWYEFFRQLEYKSVTYNSKIVKIPTYYPSSQTCSVCGYQNPIIKNLAVREWDCPKCNTHHDRDYNAANNILAKSLEIA